MVKLTQSLAHWLFENGYEKEMALISFGHIELFTPEMQKAYLEWCGTEEGKKYLEGGECYKKVERMKRFIPLLFIVFLCGCAKQIDEYPIDARYTEAYQGIETTYDYELDIFSEEGFKKMPNTHSKMFPAKYELQYRIKYDDGTSKTEWRTVARDEYEAFIGENK